MVHVRLSALEMRAELVLDFIGFVNAKSVVGLSSVIILVDGCIVLVGLSQYCRFDGHIFGLVNVVESLILDIKMAWRYLILEIEICLIKNLHGFSIDFTIIDDISTDEVIKISVLVLDLLSRTEMIGWQGVCSLNVKLGASEATYLIFSHVMPIGSQVDHDHVRAGRKCLFGINLFLAAISGFVEGMHDVGSCLWQFRLFFVIE